VVTFQKGFAVLWQFCAQSKAEVTRWPFQCSVP
jgi:hypothetical protein